MTLRKNRLGIYFVDIIVDGRRVRKTLKTRDRKLASIRAKLAERELAGSHELQRVRFEDFKVEYLEHSKAGKEWETYRSEENALNRIAPFVKGRYLDQVTPRMADQFATSISTDPKRPLAPATVNHYLRVLRSIFGTAFKWQYIELNPFGRVSMRRLERKLPRILSLEEINTVLVKAKDLQPAMAPFYEFLLLTGVRRKEAITLEWKDVDFRTGTFIVKRTKSHYPRPAFMTGRVKDILEARRALERPFPIDPDTASHRFRELATKAGIPDITLHDLRRSFASYAQDAGMPTLVLTWLIGHTNEEVTRQHYTGFDAKMVQRYLKRMERKFLTQ